MTFTKKHYETDMVAWSDEQARLLRDRNWDSLDLANLIEEIEDIGNRHRDALESHLENLLMHRLKQQFQPEKATRSWEISVQNAAREIRKLIRKHPSLRSHFSQCFDEVYGDAREAAAIETDLSLDTFPLDCAPELRLEVIGMVEG